MQPQHILMVLGMNLIWALTMLAMKLVVGEVPPLLFLTLRFFLTAVVLLPLMSIQQGQMKMLFYLAMTAGGIQFALYFTGLSMADDISAIAVVGQLSVPFAALLSVIFLGEEVRWRRWTGMGLAFAGIMIISFDPRVFSYVGAIILSGAGSMVAAVSLILMRQIKDVGVWEVQGWIAMFSWPVLIPLSFMLDGNPLPYILDAPYWVWLIMVALVLISNIGAHAGLYFLIQRYPVSLITPTMLLTPVITILLSISFMGDQVSWRMGIGMVIALVGVAIVALRQPELVPVEESRKVS